MKILVIIPCYNEEKNIQQVVESLKKAAPDVDYLIINDCSTDRSAVICKENHFSYLSLPINLGIGGSVQSGYLYAKEHNYDIAIQMDGDGQHDPAYLHTIIQPVADGKVDMCIGSRFLKKEGFQTSFMRRMGIRILSSFIYLLCGIKIRDVTSGFRACSRSLINYYADHYAQDYPEPEAILTAVLSGFRVGEAPVIMRERTNGTSSINAFKSVYYMIKVMISLVVVRLTISERRP